MYSKTLFDITTRSFDWTVLVPIIGLFLFGVALTWMEKRKIGTFVIKKIGHVLCCVAILVAALTFAIWYGKKHTGTNALRSGECSVVEGRVASFRPMPYEGHPPESFTIEKERSAYSDYAFTPCFNNTASHGGPIRPGQNLRISFMDNCVLRIELLEDGIPSS